MSVMEYGLLEDHKFRFAGERVELNWIESDWIRSEASNIFPLPSHIHPTNHSFADHLSI
jgi:hypothetical protein